jgi:hypothetical protein
MAAPLNLVFLITDGHGHHTGDHDWGTEEFRGLRTRMERLRLAEQGFSKFNNVMSPAVSTIMSIEAMLAGIHAAKTHKLHWRAWPAWDRLENPQLSDFLAGRGYAVNGFSYLLNADNWMPGVRLYRPELYRDFPSHKRDTHSHHAVLAAVRHFFAHGFEPGKPQALIVHTIFLFDLWDELMALFRQHGLTDDNTVFAFTADHYFPKNFGRQWLLAERDQSPIFHHTDLTEHNTRVFLQLKYPGLRPREIDDVVSGCDVTPTLLELLGLRDAWTAPCDGRSLVPLLDGKAWPERTLRADNVYPYQVGEKTGRIRAVRCGRYKYVSRPDPASSYIAYRLHEPWNRATGHEEFYDIPADPEEQHNLVASEDPAVRAALAHARAELRRTSDEILAFHAAGLRAHAERTGAAAELRAALPAGGRVLCVQAGPAEVATTVLQVLAALCPQTEFVLVARDAGDVAWPAKVAVRAYPAGEAISSDGVRRVLEAAGERGPWAAALRLAGVTADGWAPVYDERVHPVADFAAAGAALAAWPAAWKRTLALDGSITPVDGEARGGGGWRVRVAAAAGAALRRAKPALQRVLKRFESGGGARMPGHFSERIIRDDRIEP